MSRPTRRVTVALSELRAGVTLPADVFDAQRTSVLLLRQGVQITESQLEAMRSRGITSVIVDEQSAAILRGEAPSRPPRRLKPVEPRRQRPPEGSERLIEKVVQRTSVVPPQAVAQQLAEAKFEHVRALKEVFAAAQKDAAVNGQLARQIVTDSVSNLVEDIDAYVKVALETTESSETYEHCFATAQLAMSVAVIEGMKKQEILDVGVGCMMSRIGQSEAASRISEQFRELTAIEMMDLKRTPLRTFDCLQQMPEITVGARSVAYQIFERFNGTGYPRGRAGNQICPLARIASVCDVYIALTSPRAYRLAFEAYQAIEVLLAETRKGKFDPLAVRGLLRTVGLFPIGSFVRLSDETVGQVVRNHKDAYDRPVVHLYFDALGNCIKESQQTVDLRERPEIGIGSPVTKETVYAIMMQSLAADARVAGLTEADLDSPLQEEENWGQQLSLMFEEENP